MKKEENEKRIENLLLDRKDIDKVCIIHNDRTISYNQLYIMAIGMLSDKSDLELGDNVGIYLPNSIDYAAAYFSILFRKKSVIPIPINSKPNEVASNIRYCEINLLITAPENFEKLIKQLEKELDSKLILFSPANGKTAVVNPDKDFIYKENSNVNIDVAVMLHTSGTTSNPKRVMLTHSGLLANIKSNVESLGLTENDVTLIALPMCFGYCNTAQFLTHIYLGGSMVILGSIFTGKAFFSMIEKYRITNFTSVPTMLQIIKQFRKSGSYDITSMRYICYGGGNVSAELIEELIEKMPEIGIVQTYGQTEAGPRVTALLPKDFNDKKGSVGRAIPNVKVKIVDDDDKECIDGETGNIAVSSPAIMEGYYKNPAETERVLKNGWLYTGDMGYLLDGYLYLNGRKKNMIICGGMNIYPEEIEEIIMNITGIEAIKVYGIPDEVWGEIPVADIMLSENIKQEKVISDIRKVCIEKLSDYKIPRKFNVVDKLDRTYTGKIRR